MCRLCDPLSDAISESLSPRAKAVQEMLKEKLLRANERYRRFLDAGIISSVEGWGK